MAAWLYYDVLLCVSYCCIIWWRVIWRDGKQCGCCFGQCVEDNGWTRTIIAKWNGWGWISSVSQETAQRQRGMTGTIYYYRYYLTFRFFYFLKIEFRCLFFFVCRGIFFLLVQCSVFQCFKLMAYFRRIFYTFNV